MCKCANVRMCKLANVQICKYLPDEAKRRRVQIQVRNTKYEGRTNVQLCKCLPDEAKRRRVDFDYILLIRLVYLRMKQILLICFFFSACLPVMSQDKELLVRYDFTKNAEPPMKVFYLKVFIDGVFSDSTKPHTPHHNLANAVRVKVGNELFSIRIEGCVKEEINGKTVISKVMEVNEYFKIDRRKGRIALRLKGDYEVAVLTRDF